MLESIWDQETHHYTKEDLADARNVLVVCFHQLKRFMLSQSLGVLKELFLERRIKSLELSIQAIDHFLINNSLNT